MGAPDDLVPFPPLLEREHDLHEVHAGLRQVVLEAWRALGVLSPADLGQDRRGRAAAWEQLLGDLRRRLAANEFSDGFPGELALVEEYGVSRHTVRQASKVLGDEGLVVGARGRQSRRAEPDEIVQRLGALYSDGRASGG